MKRKKTISTQKIFQIATAALMLVSWAIIGAYSIPMSRLSTLTNYPNPFDSRNQNTTIAYYLDEDARVTVQLYDLFGYMVRRWEFFPSTEGGCRGLNRFYWDGTQEDGRKVAAGGYICQVVVKENASVVQGIRKIGVVH